MVFMFKVVLYIIYEYYSGLKIYTTVKSRRPFYEINFYISSNLGEYWKITLGNKRQIHILTIIIKIYYKLQ